VGAIFKSINKNMSNKRTHRYITKSDSFVVYRHPVAREHSYEVLNSIRETWWRIEKQYGKNKKMAGLMIYDLLDSLFGTDDVLIIEQDFSVFFDHITDWQEKDCIDWWDLADTEEM